MNRASAMAKGQAVTYKITKKRDDMRPIDELPGALQDKLAL